MSDLVGNPEDRFSRVEAHLKDELYKFLYIVAEGAAVDQPTTLPTDDTVPSTSLNRRKSSQN